MQVVLLPEFPCTIWQLVTLLDAEPLITFVYIVCLLFILPAVAGHGMLLFEDKIMNVTDLPLNKSTKMVYGKRGRRNYDAMKENARTKDHTLT